MLYLIYGIDRQKIISTVSSLVDGLKKRKPNAEVFVMTEDDLVLSKIREFAEGQGLFESKFIVVLKNVFAKKDSVDALLDILPALNLSQNVFIFSEPVNITKPISESFKKAGGKVEEHTIDDKIAGSRLFGLADARVISKEVFNVFSLADALGERDRRKLWVLFQSARKRDIPAEEMAGMFFWQIKSMILARESKGAAEAGLSPFVFQKSKRYNKNFSAEEELNLASKIVALYHDAHRGLVDFEVGLERWILGV